MQTEDEIRSTLQNIRFYSQKLEGLVKKQFDLDYKLGLELGMSTDIGALRFDCLGAITLVCSYINVFCDNAEANLQSAVEQDKTLFAL